MLNYHEAEAGYEWRNRKRGLLQQVEGSSR